MKTKEPKIVEVKVPAEVVAFRTKLHKDSVFSYSITSFQYSLVWISKTGKICNVSIRTKQMWESALIICYPFEKDNETSFNEFMRTIFNVKEIIKPA